MKIDNEFTVGVPIDRAWEVLTDLEGIAPCLPGARLTGVDGAVYTGKVKIKVGPVVSEYAGTAQFAAKDDAAYTAVIDAKGRDSRGAGNASAAIHAALRPDGDRTVVSVSTDLNVTGKIAQFGSGMIKEVSAKLLGQFAANLEEKLLAPEGAGEAPAPASSSASTPESGTTTPAPGSNGSAGATAAPSADPGGTAAPANGAAAVGTAVAEGPRSYRIEAGDEPEPVDLMALAGGSVYKRLIPVGVAALAVVGVLVLRARRRR
jgi:carbon monoxide dehydrogenase subunit G